uniref:Uncharacterized protein n=1 Tax=Aegilops tauschii TaxID=37682 RepID=R7W5D3_AEGTA
MDHTEALPDDVQAAILSRLTRRDLAACRRVRRVWLAIVDGQRLVPCNHHLPDSVEGIFTIYCSYDRPHFLGRPSTRHPGVDYGNLHFLPGYAEDNIKILDHCNGLLLYGDGYNLSNCGGMRVFCVVNPATRRWERLLGTPDEESSTAYLTFDPTVSPHYTVFLIQPKDLGLFNVRDCESAEVLPEQLIEENFTISWSSRSTSMDMEAPPHSTEWPPPELVLDVFSSSTGQWQRRPFAREGGAMTRAVNLRGRVWFMYMFLVSTCRWRYGVYCHGALHVLLYGGAFVTRFSLPSGKYKVIRTPIDANEGKVRRHYLGRLEEDVYFAKIHDQIRIWTLSESSAQVDWVFKNSIDLANISSLSPKGICKPWILDNNHVLDKYGNNKSLAGQCFDWSWDDDNILNTNERGHLRGNFLIGFHPCKETAFFLVGYYDVVAYHLNTSKVQYIGYLRPNSDCPTLGIDESFLYTPCMIGDIPLSAYSNKNEEEADDEYEYEYEDDDED